MIDWEIQRLQNLRAADAPRIGDKWTELLSFSFEVISVTKNNVRIRGHWGFEKMTRAEFKKFVRYSSMPDRTWCDVLPFVRRAAA